MADFSAEELERMADKMRSDTSGIRGTRDFTSPEELFNELLDEKVSSIYGHKPCRESIQGCL